MDAHYPKYLLYGILILGSWLISCLLHFQFFHLSLFSYGPRSGASFVLIPLSVPMALDASFLPAPSAVAEDGPLRRLSSAASSSCQGRYVYMLDVPSRFNVLRDCVEGSPAFQDEWHVCSLMANVGMGPVLPPATGNGSDGDTGVIPNTGWYATDQYALEVIVHNRMRQYECLTDDPAAATALYVPYYPGLELQQHLCGFNATVRNGPSSEFLQWMSARPQWAAFGGRDHFMVVGKTTWMFRHKEGDDSGTQKVCGNNFLEQPESGNMTVLTYESNIWDRRDCAVPYPSYFHPTSAGEVSAWQARVRATERPWLFAFAGARRANGTLAIRDRVIESCASSPSRCGFIDCSHGLEGSITCRSPRRLVSVFASSRFCLQPRGDSYMRRSSVDAIMAGCIPVFFHEASTFKKQYRWHEPDPESSGNGDGRPYSVLIDPDELLEGKVDVEGVLARYTDEEVAAMREEVIKMIPRFLYKDPRVRFEGDTRDAFDIAIDEVMARIRRIKNGEDLGRFAADDVMVAKGS
ncbi:Xyloglucan galactosyltransferase KATAMARI1-like protein [Triticum urartu]|uniref:Xyloglucan galactosyltransferase KATAMARI1-like protein n=1 Tax=Triticum urartu TaxID=4572 RepID=M8AHV9_TRIUA|nr:probable xyloglucan galactosyltransferase GT15 [Triticum urartu]EMS60329.1 Xyloglucan galactosyltransferase KATAMARI1-like protein [Triticum urartu]